MIENGIEKFFVGKCGECEIFFVTLQRNSEKTVNIG